MKGHRNDLVVHVAGVGRARSEFQYSRGGNGEEAIFDLNFHKTLLQPRTRDYLRTLSLGEARDL